MDSARNTKRPRHDIDSTLQLPPEAAAAPDPVTPVGNPSAIPDVMPDSTPISYKVSGSRVHASKYVFAQEHKMRLERETRGHWVGPMDPAVFIGRFLPPVTGNVVRPAFTKKTFAKVGRASREVRMYRPFIDAMSPFCPELKLVDTHANVDSIRDSIAVDISAYQVNANGQCGITKCDFSQMEVPVELKHKDAYDPFSDYERVLPATKEKPYPFERNDETALAIDARGQIAAYSSALMGAQFRLHSFSVFIVGEWARLLRWDRNGAIVTRKFQYNEDDSLIEFFWRYSHAPRHDPSGMSRGHDPTVRTLISSHKSTPKELDAQEDLKRANHRYHTEFRTMIIPDRDTGEEFPFLISYPPRYFTRSPFGRCTRPMLAFDIKQEKMVFVKDYWRSVGDNLEKEGDIYKILEDKKVPYIAPFGKGNDIRDHVTLTDNVKSERWAYPTGKMVPLRHYRMSLDEVGRPLNEFKSSYELVTAIADAMEAHEFAFYDAKILHRDISAGNILITGNGNGMLIDWDLCLNLNKLQEKARRPDRTGTWQFLSFFLISNAKHFQNVIDDKESSLYVLLWNLLRYTQHNKVEKLYEELKLFDEVSDFDNDGGIRKRDFLYMKNTEFTFKDRPHLDSLIQDLSHTFLARYEKPKPMELALFATPEGAKSIFNPLIRIGKLEERKWLVQTFRAHLALEGWPEDDAASFNPIVGPGTAAQQEKRHESLVKNDVGPSSLKRDHSDS